MAPLFIQKLPDEALLLVMARLPVTSVLALRATCRQLSTLAAANHFWKEVAVRQWGPVAAEQSVSENWMEYCQSRMSFRTVANSPFRLVQEKYTDPWQHLVCCLTCTRTSGSETVQNTIETLLRGFPTPSAMAGADEGELKAVLRPVGLQDARCRALQRMSSDFLLTAWKTPQQFYGCGKFVSDSWRIFCTGETSCRGVEDVNLKRYLHWLATGRAGTRTGNTTADQPVGGTTARSVAALGRSSRKGTAKRKTLRSRQNDAVTVVVRQQSGMALRRSTRTTARGKEKR